MLNRKRSHILNLFLLLFLAFGTKAMGNQSDLSVYLAKNSIVSPLSEAGPRSTRSELIKSAQEHKIIFIGEADHYYHEKFKYRLKFIEFYLSQGFYNIIAEIGQEDGLMVNAFLNSGDEDYLKKVGLYGFHFGQELQYNQRNLTKELVRYYKALRKLKQKYPKLNYGGYDLDMFPGTFLLSLSYYQQMKFF